MRPALRLLAAAASLSVAAGASAQAPAAPETLKELTSYKFGMSAVPLIKLQEKVRASATIPEESRQLARAFTGVLKSDATQEGKTFACRQLALIGEEEEVPVLAALLGDVRLSDYARYALERIPGRLSVAALIESLGRLEGPPLTGVINSLGVIRDARAIEALVSHLSGPDETAACASAAALGKIGGDRAAEALAKARASAGPRLKTAIADAYLLCADHDLARGNADAEHLYREVFECAGPPQARAAALRGIVRVKGADGFRDVLKAVSDKDPIMRSAGLGLVGQMEAGNESKAVTEFFPSLDADVKVLLLQALALRDDSIGLESVRDAAASDDPAVRTAGLRALGRLGGAKAIPVLVRAAAGDDKTQRDAGRHSLDRLRGLDVDAAMIRMLTDSDPKVRSDPRVRSELIRSLAERHATPAVPAIRKALLDSDSGVRLEAAKALGSLGDTGSLSDLLAVIRNAETEKIRKAAGKSVNSICGRGSKETDCEKKLVASLDGAGEAAHVSILELLPVAAGEKALAAARQSLGHESGRVRQSAVKALGQWPDPVPAPDLIAIARGNGPEKERVLALRGYIRLAVLPSDRDGEATAIMFRDAYQAAFRTEDRKKILAETAGICQPVTLELVRSCLDDPKVKKEAALAALEIVRGLQRTHTLQCMEVMKQVRKATGDKETREKADLAFAALKKMGRFVTAWMVSGPYTATELKDSALLDHVFLPETNPGQAGWFPLLQDPKDEKPWQVNLLDAVKGNSRVAYLRTYVFSRKARRVRMDLGSDDGVKAWLNGELVLTNHSTRGITDGSDRVKVRLRRGWNEVTLKISQGGGWWAASLKFSRSFGRSVPGLRISPEQPE